MEQIYRERNQLLVDALLSGEYKQGKNALEYTDGEGQLRHCCLGVACRVAMANGLEVETIEESNYVKFGGYGGFPPISVVKWFGWVSDNPALLLSNGEKKAAVTLNDSENYDFDDIAAAFKRTFVDVD